MGVGGRQQVQSVAPSPSKISQGSRRAAPFFLFFRSFLKGDLSYNEYGRSVDLAGISGWDGVGWDGISKVSFNFLYTLWVYRSCIHILIYIFEYCPHKFLVGLKLWSSWGSGCKNSKTSCWQDIFKISLKVTYL